MPRRYLKRIMPDHRTMREHPHLQRFGERLTEPKLWHLNRRSIAFGLAIGLFVGFMPIPFQMVVSAALAIVVRVNLPIAIMAVWITNPVTMGPLYYMCYEVGALLLDVPTSDQAFSMSWEWFSTVFTTIWEPLLLGCFVLGSAAAVIAILIVRLIWRIIVIRNWIKRQQKG